MVYNGCMTITENDITHMYHEDGIIPTPHGYTSTFCTLAPGPQDIFFQMFYKEDKDTTTRKRFRVSIRRNSFDHQSYCEVEMFMMGVGWSRLLHMPMTQSELKNVSWFALDNPTQEKYNQVFTIMSNVSCAVLNSALHIL